MAEFVIIIDQKKEFRQKNTDLLVHINFCHIMQELYDNKI